MTYITREEWGARPPSRGRNSINSRPLGTAIHWNGPGCAGQIRKHSQCAGFVRGIQNFHMDVRRWSDIAYTDFACPHGDIFEGRGKSVGTAANGTTWGNQNYYAVYLMWGEGDGTPPDAMLDAAADAVAMHRSWGAGDDVTTHRALYATACPGDEIAGMVEAGRFDGGRGGGAQDVAFTPPKPKRQSGGFKPLWTPTGKLNTREVQKIVGVTADNLYGKDTKAAVAAYQRKLGVDDDGLWGKTTEAAHFASKRKPWKRKPKRKRAARLAVDGLRGPATISALQRWVGAPVDGALGPVTVRHLQRKLGVTADGIAGPVTVKALQRKVGTTVDGAWGPGTTAALQRFLNKALS